MIDRNLWLSISESSQSDFAAAAAAGFEGKSKSHVRYRWFFLLDRSLMNWTNQAEQLESKVLKIWDDVFDDGKVSRVEILKVNSFQDQAHGRFHVTLSDLQCSHVQLVVP